MSTSASSPASVLLICPVRNEVARVDDMVESVMAQSSHDWRLVFFDNASTDGTFEKLELISKMDLRVEVFSLENPIPIHENFVRAFSYAQAAKEEFLQFIAADDCLGHDDYLKEALSLLRTTGGNLALGRIQHFNNYGALEVNDFKELPDKDIDGKFQKFAVSNYWICNGIYGFYQRSFFLEVLQSRTGAFTNNLSSDWWFSFNALTLSWPVYSRELVYRKFRKELPYSAGHYSLAPDRKRLFRNLSEGILFPFRNLGDRRHMISNAEIVRFLIGFIVRDLRTFFQIVRRR